MQATKDVDQRARLCNAVRKNGQRCFFKIKRAQRDEQLANNQLPVCQVHKDQNVTLGRCEATSSCGERCNRLILWAPCENQLCSDHEGFELPCHLLKLPVELRLQIFEYFIPDGHIGAYGASNYRYAAKFLRLNHQIHAEITGLLFGSVARSCDITFDGGNFKLLGSKYNLDFANGARSARHSSQAIHHRPDRASHINLNINASRFYEGEKGLYVGLVNLWYLVKAICP